MRYELDGENLFIIQPLNLRVVHHEDGRVFYETASPIISRGRDRVSVSIPVFATSFDDIDVNYILSSHNLAPDVVSNLDEVLPPKGQETYYKIWQISSPIYAAQRKHSPILTKVLELQKSHENQQKQKVRGYSIIWNSLPQEITLATFRNRVTGHNVRIIQKRREIDHDEMQYTSVLNRLQDYSGTYLVNEADNAVYRITVNMGRYVTRTGRIARQRFYNDHVRVIELLSQTNCYARRGRLFYYEILKELLSNAQTRFVDLFNNEINSLTDDNS